MSALKSTLQDNNYSITSTNSSSSADTSPSTSSSYQLLAVVIGCNAKKNKVFVSCLSVPTTCDYVMQKQDYLVQCPHHLQRGSTSAVIAPGHKQKLQSFCVMYPHHL